MKTTTVTTDRSNTGDWLDRYLADPALSPKAFIRKRLIWIWTAAAAVGISCMTLLAAFRGMGPVIVFGLVLLFYYALFLPLLKHIRRFELANFIFLIVTILTTFVTILYVGGLPNAFGLYLIGLTCAMASMLWNRRQWTIILFLIYGLTIIAAALLQPWLSVPPDITDGDRLLFYTINIVWISASTLQFTLDYINERGQYEEAENKRLKELDEIKTKVYTNITHEFRTPLTVILGMADQIEKAPERWLKPGVQKIREHSKMLLHLINQMLNLSKLETGAMPLHLVQGDVITYLRYLGESFRSFAQSNHIDLRFSSSLDTLPMDYDPEKWQPIISNLLSNALKYTPPGGQVLLSAERENTNGAWLIIRVRDTGIGIPPDQAAHIFERFFRVEDDRAPQPHSGSGLGLALTRELVHLLQGHISVASEPGRGTEFTVRLPVTQSAPPQAETLPKPSADALELYLPPSTQLPSKKEAASVMTAEDEKPLLLIVEDNRDVIEYLAALLDSDYRLETAADGQEGLEKAIQMIPDIILSDVMMPRMDGFALLEKVKTDWRTSHIPVVLLTAKADIDSRLTGLEQGADAYLAKPFHEEELKIRLRQLILLRRKLRQRYAGSAALQLPDPELKLEDKFILRLQKKLDEHLDDIDFGVEALARAMAISRAQLYRKLMALTGQSVNRYILSYRLQQARRLLETTDLNVTEVAYEVGFKNLSHFSHAFHEKFELPPSALRKGGP